jgi:hypothetical protein
VREGKALAEIVGLGITPPRLTRPEAVTPSNRVIGYASVAIGKSVKIGLGRSYV